MSTERFLDKYITIAREVATNHKLHSDIEVIKITANFYPEQRPYQTHRLHILYRGMNLFAYLQIREDTDLRAELAPLFDDLALHPPKEFADAD